MLILNNIDPVSINLAYLRLFADSSATASTRQAIDCLSVFGNPGLTLDTPEYLIRDFYLSGCSF